MPAKIVSSAGVSLLVAGLSLIGVTASALAQNASPTPPPTSAAIPATAPATQNPAAAAALAEVVAAMGAADVTAITYSGTAWRIRNSFMQTPNASPPWPARDAIANYRMTIDLGQPRLSARGETYAQNLFLDPPVAGAYTLNIPATQRNWTQQLELWLTPWGFLHGAAKHGVEVSQRTVEGVAYTVLGWRSPEEQKSPAGLRYAVNGYVNDKKLLARTETWVEHPFMGDFHIVQTYDGYRAIDGVMVPQTIEQWRGGGAVFGVHVTAATKNPAHLGELFPAPAAPGAAGGRGGAPGGAARGGGAPGGPGAAAIAPASLAERIDDNTYLINGSYVSLVMAFSDHVLVFEAGESEAGGRRVLDEVKRLFPNKPLRYLVNSHPHSDHTAGIVPFIRAGATLVTHENNVAFLTQALSTPRTLQGEETLAPKVQGVKNVTVFEDNTNRLELHTIYNLHSDGMVVGFLPKQKILFQADFSLPRPGVKANSFVLELANYVDRTGLDFVRYIPVHSGQGTPTKADLMATIGK